jgi:hypothetical protein
MGNAQDHALGRNRKFYAKKEADGAYGTYIKPVGADAAKVLSCSFDYSQERKNRLDSRTSRSQYTDASDTGRITGRKAVNWSLEAYLIPAGSGSTDPDLFELFEAAMGSKSSQVFSLTSNQALNSLCLTQRIGDVVMEAITGAYVETMTISMSGGDDPKVSFDGGASDYIVTSTSTTNGTGSTSSTLVVNDADAFEIGSVIAIASDDNSGAGYKVTNKSTTTLTLEDTASWSNSAAVTPFTAAEATVGSPSPGITGSVTLAGNSGIEIVAFEVTLKNNIKPMADEAFSAVVTDFIPGYREVTGSLTVRCAKDQALELGKRRSFGTRDLQVVSGSGTGKVCTIDLDDVEFQFSALDIPESEEVVITLPFIALASSATANDELTITFS